MKTILVAGASGYLGQHLVKSLNQQNFKVVALVRKKEKVEHLKPFINQILEAQVTQPSSLKQKLNNIDIIISTIGITKQGDGLTYMDVDYQANMNLLQAALECGVKKFIYVSVLNANAMKQLKIIEAKVKFAEALKQSGMNYTIVNPNGFFSDMAEIFEMAKKGTVYLFGDGHFKANPIDGKDLADSIVSNLESGTKEYDIGGPQILSQNEIAELAFDVLDTKRKVRYIPLWVSKFLIKMLRFLTPQKVYGPIEFFMTVLTRDMVCEKFGKTTLKDFFGELKKKGK